MLVYQKSYWNSLIQSSCKLFLESYFDLVICTLINLFAFIEYNSEFATFFIGSSNKLSSVSTIVFTVLITLFPLTTWFIINFSQADLSYYEDEFLNVVMKGVNPNNYHASIYTVYFLMRRLATGLILITFKNYPEF